MLNFERITWNPKRMNGQPCIRDMRLTVRRVVEAVAQYPNREDLLRNYPELEPDDIQQAWHSLRRIWKTVRWKATRRKARVSYPCDWCWTRGFRATRPPSCATSASIACMLARSACTRPRSTLTHAILAVARASGPSVIRLRAQGLGARHVVEHVQRVLGRFESELHRGCLVTVKDRKITCHRLPVGGGD